MISQDDQAYKLMEDLFRGRARRLPDVERAFEVAHLPGWREYLILGGVSITRTEIEGYHWAYRWQAQLARIRREFLSEEIVADVERDYDWKWEDVSITVFDQVIQDQGGGHMKTQISNRLIERSVYVVGGEWTRFTNDGKGRFCVLGRELRLEDRQWMFDELEGWAAGTFPIENPDEIWEGYSQYWEGRVTKDQFDRCVRLANMYQTTDTKAIFPVGS